MKRGTPHANRGKGLEELLESFHRYLKNARIASIAKREVGKIIENNKIIYTEKQGFDYQGTLRGGLSICIEAKETHEPRLDIKGSGLQEHQARELMFNGELGAIAGVIWCYKSINPPIKEIYALGHTFLGYFMKNHYGKGKGRRKSIPLDMIKRHCNRLDLHSIPQYDQLFKEKVDNGKINPVYRW